MATALYQIDFDRADAMLIGPTSALRYVIAECIAHERERCAQIAEYQGKIAGNTDVQNAHIYCANAIAKAIREFKTGTVTQDERGT